MATQDDAPVPGEGFEFQPQDRKALHTGEKIIGVVLSLIVVGLAFYQLREIDLSKIVSLVPSSPVFWSIFCVSYLIAPASDWVIFRRLWGVGGRAFGALVRKLIYNEMLVGYLGEAYFYGWARHNLRFVSAPFGAVKDVAILSAVAGNVTTLIFFAATFPLLRLLPLGEHVSAIGLSLAVIIGTSLAVILLRGLIFSIERKELLIVFAVHLVRILAITVLLAYMWHIILPEIDFAWWILLVNTRLLVSRLPLLPNKDILFAGIAILVIGQVEISELMALMAGLTLCCHVFSALVLAILDILSGKNSGEADLA